MLISCVLSSKSWIEVLGSGVGDDVKRNLRDQGYIIKGFIDSNMVIVFKHSIPIAATFRGICIGALTIFADFIGAIGSRKGILLVYEYKKREK